MKTPFHVGPAWWDYDEIVQTRPIKAETAREAAAEYVRLNHANLDYAAEVKIKTVNFDEEEGAVIRRFEVIQVPAFEAQEIKRSGQ